MYIYIYIYVYMYGLEDFIDRSKSCVASKLTILIFTQASQAPN